MTGARLAVLLGVLAVTLPGLGFGAALAPSPPAPVAWPRTPHQPPLPPAARAPRWDRPSQASLAQLRRVTAKESRLSIAALADCEARARARTTPAAARGDRYRRCALAPLARAGSFATANSHMLSSLLTGAGATPACGALVLALSNDTGILAHLAHSTLRGGEGTTWVELLAASRSIRGIARDALRLAREPSWQTTCRARPPAPDPPSGPVA